MFKMLFKTALKSRGVQLVE